MVLLFAAVQGALWAHAGQLVQAAAAQGVRAAGLSGGAPSVARQGALSFLARSGAHTVTGVQVSTSDASGSGVTVTVTGRAESILPWFHLDVGASRVGTVQTFRASA